MEKEKKIKKKTVLLQKKLKSQPPPVLPRYQPLHLHKLADKWEKDVYLVVEQPNKPIPVYVVKREHGRGATKILHRNLLLPFMALPLSKPGVDSTVEPSNSSQPSPVEVKTVGDNLESKQGSRDAVNTASTAAGGIEQAGIAVPRYVIPQKRSTLNPLAPPFTPRLTSPGTLRPRVLPSRTRRQTDRPLRLYGPRTGKYTIYKLFTKDHK